jgi:tetratricopeptide (TPR) repeat protein
VALEELELPFIRSRKLFTILQALEVQIENGGDHPQVNHLLLEALRQGVLHQVSEARGQAALAAMDTYERAEAERWRQIRTGTWPGPQYTPEERFHDLVSQGYRHLEEGDTTTACDRWLEAWAALKPMLTQEMRCVEDVDEIYPGLTPLIYNWTADLEMELHNAGIDDSAYHEQRMHYIRELLEQFPKEDADRQVIFRNAEGEALWYLGRYDKAETVYRRMVARFPDKGWAHIFWASRYWFPSDSPPPDYERAEALLQRALERPQLEDREDVLERLADVYESWGKKRERAQTLARLQRERRGGRSAKAVPPLEKPGRNDPCWCGSGKKYKHCHLRSDRRGR